MRDSYVYYKDKLNDEYRTVFDQVEMYVLSQNIEDKMVEERLGALLDIFFSAMERGKSVKEITGNHLESFCKTFCSDFGVKNRILHVLEWFKSIAKVLLAISVLEIFFLILESLETGQMDFWKNVSILNISGYFIGIFVSGVFAMALNIILCRIMFRTKRISMKVLRALSCSSAVLGFFIIFYILSLDSTDFIRCPVWVVLVLSSVYLFLYYILYGRRVKRDKVKLLDLVQEESKKGLPEEMEKKFDKARKRSLKKGKGELTLEEFLDKEERECGKVENLKLFYILLPIVIIIVSFVWTLIADGFESPADMVIFVVIMMIVEYPLMLGLWKISSIGVKERREWIEAKREELQ